MKLTVRISTRAWRDADNIFRWLDARSHAGASAWFEAFLSASQSLANQFEAFGFAPEGEPIERSIRHRFFKTRRGRIYRILYLVEHDEVIVLRIRGPGQPPLTPDELIH
jgi:plasmid stabilization system protein ParE